MKQQKVVSALKSKSPFKDSAKMVEDPIDAALSSRKQGGAADSVISTADARRQKIPVPVALGLKTSGRSNLIEFDLPEKLAEPTVAQSNRTQKSFNYTNRSKPARESEFEVQEKLAEPAVAQSNRTQKSMKSTNRSKPARESRQQALERPAADQSITGSSIKTEQTAR